MKDLIERLENAMGPDREIDLATHVAIYPDGDIAKLMQFRRGFDHKEGMAWDIHHGGSVCFEKWTADGRCPYNGGYPLPAYTASFDAALTLVPEGWIWDVASSGAAWIMPPDDLEGQLVVGGIENPVIALCIAALKARCSPSSTRRAAESA